MEVALETIIQPHQAGTVSHNHFMCLSLTTLTLSNLLGHKIHSVQLCTILKLDLIVMMTVIDI